jgi:glycosyltransferase involved in cell wall biosynthesis
MMRSIIYWNNIPAPYVIDRFNALARRGKYDFEAWFSGRTKADRSWVVDESKWIFPYQYLPAVGKGAYPFAIPTPLLRGEAPDLFVSLYAAPTFLLGWALARARGARTAFWVEVTHDAWVKRRRWKEAMKSKIFPRVDGVLTPGEDGRRFALGYGAKDERIHCVPHVIDAEHYARRSTLTAEERRALRRTLGLRGVTFAYVGRLYVEKGLTFLIDAFSELEMRQPQDVSLLFVGNGPDEDLLRVYSAKKSLRNVTFCGFQDAESLPKIYAAIDVFVFPTLGEPFGLVVLEAMACGLPVIASDTAGEISARVTDGMNGFLVRPGETKQLLERMTLLAQDADLRQRMGMASAQKVAGQSPELWAEAFEQAVEAIFAMPTRNLRVEQAVALGRDRRAKVR